jgi:DNA-binding response OmpR family regulator
MTNQMMPSIMIVDDDESICKTLSAILHAEGYQTTTATTAREAIEKAKTQFFNLALLDIKLPDLEGTRLLAQLQGIAPETIKIMITGYPSLKNAVEALNFGADSYIMKPIDPAELLKIIKSKLEFQRQAERITKEKLAEWVQSQARKARASNFQEYLENAADELANFGLTKTQAKIYVTLIASGVASASEIGKSSKIRREEVYRLIPELEKRGLITRKLKAPKKFSAIKPETALQILTKAKLNTMKEEIDRLKQKQTDLISKLKTVELPIKQEDCSIEVISQLDNALAKLVDMTGKAREKIDVVAPLQDLIIVYVDFPRNIIERMFESVKMRIIVENAEVDAVTKELLHFSEADNNRIELRQNEKPPIRLMIVDDKEAMWGEVQPGNDHGDPKSFWTDDPTQISILKMSFDSLWQDSSAIRKT